VLRYRGRTVTDGDVAFIRRLVEENANASRRMLSKQLCAAWGWRQPNGALCDLVARGLMLVLERQGVIELPARRRVPNNPLARRHRPATVAIDTTAIDGALERLRPLTFRQVRRTPEEALFNGLIEQHHYLGYTQPVGAHLKYLVFAGERPVAALSFSSAPRHLGARDRFIGWSPQARCCNLGSIAYNPRFLILPWVKVPHLASHVLGVMARVLAADWEQAYGRALHFLETFVDPQRYRGTCYRAANWVVLGETTGRGHNAPSKRQTRSIKQVLGYPLTPHFRERLCEVR
jgi:hypothetical protein